jgi:hypothetical protein
MKRRVRWEAALIFVGVTGCQAPGGSTLEVPSDAAETCRDLCHQIGLRLSAVAIMADNVGCVCQAAEGATAGRQEAVTGGMATIFLQEQERRRQQQAHQQQAQQQSFKP